MNLLLGTKLIHASKTFRSPSLLNSKVLRTRNLSSIETNSTHLVKKRRYLKKKYDF